MLVDNNPLVPSRIAALIDGTGEDPTETLIRKARALEQAGMDALAMPCNTAHHYADRIQSSVGIPLLNMVELVAKKIRRAFFRKPCVGFLASPAVRIARIYDVALAAHGLTAVYPENDEPVLAAIKSIKAGHEKSKSLAPLQTAIRDLGAQGADCIVVACTELSLISDKLKSDAKMFDALDILADEIVEYACDLPTLRLLNVRR